MAHPCLQHPKNVDSNVLLGGALLVSMTIISQEIFQEEGAFGVSSVVQPVVEGSDTSDHVVFITRGYTYHTCP